MSRYKLRANYDIENIDSQKMDGTGIAFEFQYPVKGLTFGFIFGELCEIDQSFSGFLEAEIDRCVAVSAAGQQNRFHLSGKQRVNQMLRLLMRMVPGIL